jgi:NTE family protein
MLKRITISIYNAAILAGLSGCATWIDSAPRNEPIAIAQAEAPTQPKDFVDSHVIGLSFSGGGLRAAAFAFGVLQELYDARARHSLLPDIGFISSVSGGSLLAAYYGLHGIDAMQTFRSAALERNLESRMRLSAWTPNSLIRLFKGGLNDRTHLASVMQADIFKNATFADIYRRGRPDIWINATDIYNRTPFPFTESLFSAICSNLGRYSVAEAVYASMAVPLVFSPTVLQSYPDNCTTPLPEWTSHAKDHRTPLVLKAAAQAVRNYRDPAVMRYVKLVDGGVTDNAGLSSILIARAASGTAYGPLSALDAVRVSRLLFLVVDSGRTPVASWALTTEGPSGIDMISASTDSAIDAAFRVTHDAFIEMVKVWQASVIEFRCTLTFAQRQQYGLTQDWACNQVIFDVGYIGFADLSESTYRQVNAIPTRLFMSGHQIDAAIAAGREAASINPALKAYRVSKIQAIKVTMDK